MTFHFPENVTIDPAHIWCQVFDSAKRFKNARPALFLDRDGVIVEEVHYLHQVEDVTLIEGASNVIAQANARDIAVVIVTNQAGIARDMFGWEEFSAVQQRMLDLLHEQTGAFVDAGYACPHHKVGKPPFGHGNHEARKPNPGMLTRAMDAIDIQATQSWIVGDKASDLQAGRAAGLCGGIHVLSGHGSDAGEVEKAEQLANKSFHVKLMKAIKYTSEVIF
jgi:D-glycero-D-manno-heptose 1,7-bisphosphate phosphatase